MVARFRSEAWLPLPWVPEVFSRYRRGASFCRPQAATRVRPQDEDTWTKPETAHEKPLAPRVGCSYYYLMVGIRSSGISIQMSLLMLFGWSLMWIASLILREYRWGSRSTLSQSGWCPVLLACSFVSKSYSFVENVTEFKKQSSNIRTHYWN